MSESGSESLSILFPAVCILEDSWLFHAFVVSSIWILFPLISACKIADSYLNTSHSRNTSAHNSQYRCSVWLLPATCWAFQTQLAYGLLRRGHKYVCHKCFDCITGLHRAPAFSLISHSLPPNHEGTYFRLCVSAAAHSRYQCLH